LELKDVITAWSLTPSLAFFNARVRGISADDTPAKDEEMVNEHTPYPHIFVTCNAADAFGAIPAGHNA